MIILINVCLNMMSGTSSTICNKNSATECLYYCLILKVIMCYFLLRIMVILSCFCRYHIIDLRKFHYLPRIFVPNSS